MVRFLLFTKKGPTTLLDNKPWLDNGMYTKIQMEICRDIFEHFRTAEEFKNIAPDFSDEPVGNMMRHSTKCSKMALSKS